MFPTYNICGYFLCLSVSMLLNVFVNASITALAPKYEPPIPITTNMSDSFFIFFAAFFILKNSFLSYFVGNSNHPTKSFSSFAFLCSSLCIFSTCSLYSIIDFCGIPVFFKFNFIPAIYLYLLSFFHIIYDLFYKFNTKFYFIFCNQFSIFS